MTAGSRAIDSGLAGIAAGRYSRQSLGSANDSSTARVVARFAAVQAQEYEQSKWSLTQRSAVETSTAIEAEIDAGKILRTHVLRPTWHFVAAEDLNWLLSLSAPRVHATNGFMYRKCELDIATLERACHLLAAELSGNEVRTRVELAEVLSKQGITASGHRLSYIMMYAELEKVICSGPRIGKQFTYAAFNERVPAGVSPSDPLAELARRYFATRGAATRKDFATWSGLTLTQADAGIAGVSDLAHIDIDKQRYFFRDEASQFCDDPKTPGGLRLLSVLDEYIVGYRDREPVFALWDSLGKPPLRHDCLIVASDGQVVGTWQRKLKSSHLLATCSFFAQVDAEELVHERDALEEFMHMPVKLVVAD